MVFLGFSRFFGFLVRFFMVFPFKKNYIKHIKIKRFDHVLTVDVSPKAKAKKVTKVFWQLGM